MIEEIRRGLYRIQVPLPGNPLGNVNSYVIKDLEQSLIIDTGLNRPECLHALSAGLDELAVDPAQCDYFITHVHADHLSLVDRLASDQSRVFMGRADQEFRDNWFDLEAIIGFARCHGFPEDHLQAAIKAHPGLKYGPEKIVALTPVDEGDLLQYGGFCFRAIITPGHTVGHTCLYEPEHRLLVAGDTVLGDITPNIQGWLEGLNPLGLFLQSLQRLRELDVDLTLTGHRSLVTDLRARIDELKLHHQARVQELLNLLGDGPMNAYQIASLMTWDIDCESWDAFPPAQKWFAVGETLAHLHYLEDLGRIELIGPSEAQQYRIT